MSYCVQIDVISYCVCFAVLCSCYIHLIVFVFVMSVAIPRLSATVLLLSQNAPALRAANLTTSMTANNKDKTQSPMPQTKEGISQKSTSNFKVLMVRRHGKARFMPNKYVFPGGSVEESDVECAKRLHVPVQRFIALRELSEETHCVLRANGSLCSSSCWQKEEEQYMHCKNNNSSIEFNLRKNKNHKMPCCGYDVEAASRLILLARWITPPTYPYRYDTYFYGAIVDNNDYSDDNKYCNLSKNYLDGISSTNRTHAQQIALEYQTKELTEANWYAPLDILRRHEAVSRENNNCSVAPITYFMLHALAQYQYLQEIKQLWSEVTGHCLDKSTTTLVSKNNKINIDETNIRAVISEEDNPDEHCTNKQLERETRMRIPANYIIHMGHKALLPPGHYNIVKECVHGVQRITHLTVEDANAPEDKDKNENKNMCDDEILLRH